MKILMVCLGNICRSPLAHGILAQAIKKNNLDWQVDSAGTSSWHEGSKPDARSIEVADKHSIDISGQRSQKLIPAHLEEYDIIMAMDSSNYIDIKAMSSNDAQKSKIKLLLNYSFPGENKQVPDPYYEGGFELVFQLINDAVHAFVNLHK